MKKLVILLALTLGLLTACSEKKPEMVTETVAVQGEKQEVAKTETTTATTETAVATTETKTEETKAAESAPSTEVTTSPEAKPTEVVTETKTEEAKPAETTPTPTKVEEPVKSTPVAAGTTMFTNSLNVKVLDKPGSTNKGDTLRKGTRVTVLEETMYGEKNPTAYVKVKYKKDNKESTGWMPKKDLVGSLQAVIPASWGKLNFTPIEKPAYPNNPKVVVKGIYVSSTWISSPKLLDQLLRLAKETEINAFVIDVKNDDGHLLWAMPSVTGKVNVPEADRRAPVKDIAALMKKLKDNNIYTIARVVSFKDPTYAKAKPDRQIMDKRTGKPFTNADKLVWVSAHDRDLWQYNIDVSKEAAKAGFNEIQFDYVRFPASNGGKLDASLDYRNTKNESKPATIQGFLLEARKQISPMGVYIAADIYGQVGSSLDDMGLGQHWESVSNVVDYVSPMVYPSHYGNGLYGTKVPDAEPYKTVYGSTRDSINRNYNIDHPAVIRTWIQDFTAPWVKGHIKYGVNEVRAQIKALNDLGIQDYILWNAANKYSFGKEKGIQ